ncbi:MULTISPECIES: NAD(P)/FAD-dependent oxidoreductase [unclassified Streptomyces]|uniref:phytoene desaturase family protein n=1 Tax=unclassified Streptomyces TaxID=2593676 RepID=UPI0027E4358D|nr:MULTISPECIES: NAD(P)/FAD-dependent oxidoreductase [unclassified Streptomyces]MCH0566467.1 NAD(P)/FAD-dependent oxidoreductase [Streptomyces sp. MUM 2J]MCH0571885.1 NAD(P)/FAD-dependent oxidoreductase [Streptomyces sp. MUM 136J]
MATDVVVVGSGPNGLAAAVTMARAGLSVAVYEAAADIGGGLRTQSLFRDDVVHDICSAVHPMAPASAFFREFDLAARNVELLQPEISYAHPLDNGQAALAHHALDATCAGLGRDGRAWRALMEPLLARSQAVVDFALGGQRSLPRDPHAPLLLGLGMLRHGTPLARHAFTGQKAAALLAGVAAHALGRMPTPSSAAVALLLGHLAHGTGWPLPRGGSRRIAEAMVSDLRTHGATLSTGQRIDDLRDTCDARAVLLDLGPKEFLRIAGPLLPRTYRMGLHAFRYGPAAAKVDFLTSGPIPWAAPEVGPAGTVHLGGLQKDVFRQESLVARGRPGGEPFVLVVDPATTDPGRIGAGGHRPVWAYAHVPHADPTDPADVVTARIERYAPGFADTVLARRSLTALDLEQYNPNYVGGDIAAGAMTLRQTLLRPLPRWNPYRTPLPGVYLCSASTPPGPGVHGMAGHLAAICALHREFGIRTPPSLSPDTPPTP